MKFKRFKKLTNFKKLKGKTRLVLLIFPSRGVKACFKTKFCLFKNTGIKKFKSRHDEFEKDKNPDEQNRQNKLKFSDTVDLPVGILTLKTFHSAEHSRGSTSTEAPTEEVVKEKKDNSNLKINVYDVKFQTRNVKRRDSRVLKSLRPSVTSYQPTGNCVPCASSPPLPHNGLF